MAYVRCTYCRTRRTLNFYPQEYLRIPPCRTPGCNNRRKRRGLPISYYVDKWRERHERAPYAPKPCKCGEVYGPTGEFPHRRGSGHCIHNPHRKERD